MLRKNRAAAVALVVVACGGANTNNANRLTASPSKPARPTTGQECVTTPNESAEVMAWRARGTVAIDARLPAMNHCFAKVDEKVYLHITLAHVSAQQRKALITGSTRDDCDLTQCVKSALQGLELGTPPSVAEPSALDLQEYVSFEPKATPRLSLTTTPDVGLPPPGSCTDQDLMPKGGRLEPVHIQTVVRHASPEFQRCFEAGLGRDPQLHGRVATRFVVGPSGEVKSVATVSNSLPDCEVVSCIRERFKPLKFDPPKGGDVSVVYPLSFQPR